MDRQTSMNNGGTPTGTVPPRTVVNSVAGFSRDILNLAELQTKLALVDAKETVAKAKVLLGVGALASVLFVGAVLLVLSGLSGFLASHFEIPRWGAELLVGAGTVLFMALLLVITWQAIGRCFVCFDRSKTELRRNLEWIKNVVSSRN